MFLALLTHIVISFITICFFSRVALWVFERFQFVHYVIAFIAAIIVALCSGDEVRKLEKLIYHDEPKVTQAAFQDQKLKELYFNDELAEWRIVGESTVLRRSIDQVTFSKLTSLYTVPHFVELDRDGYVQVYVHCLPPYSSKVATLDDWYRELAACN